MRAVYMMGTALFVIMAGLQLNDPDAAMWMGAYAYAAVIGIYGEAGRKRLLFPAVGFLAYAYLLTRLDPYFGTGWMDDEVTREFFGLVICEVWMVVIWFLWYREKARWF